jgi:hypothetical protein
LVGFAEGKGELVGGHDFAVFFATFGPHPGGSVGVRLGSESSKVLVELFKTSNCVGPG